MRDAVARDPRVLLPSTQPMRPLEDLFAPLERVGIARRNIFFTRGDAVPLGRDPLRAVTLAFVRAVFDAADSMLQQQYAAFTERDDVQQAIADLRAGRAAPGGAVVAADRLAHLPPAEIAVELFKSCSTHGRNDMRPDVARAALWPSQIALLPWSPPASAQAAAPVMVPLASGDVTVRSALARVASVISAGTHFHSEPDVRAEVDVDQTVRALVGGSGGIRTLYYERDPTVDRLAL